jgi:hypothetical protein
MGRQGDRHGKKWRLFTGKLEAQKKTQKLGGGEDDEGEEGGGDLCQWRQRIRCDGTVSNSIYRIATAVGSQIFI